MVTLKWSSGKVKKGKGHGGESMEFKSVRTVQSGAWEAPSPAIWWQ